MLDGSRRLSSRRVPLLLFALVSEPQLLRVDAERLEGVDGQQQVADVRLTDRGQDHPTSSGGLGHLIIVHMVSVHLEPGSYIYPTEPIKNGKRSIFNCGAVDVSL